MNQMFVRWQCRAERPEPTDFDLALASAWMFFKGRGRVWTSQPMKRSGKPRFVALIVESRRIDGRPRQRLVRYIGSIARADVRLLAARRRFWALADARLAVFPIEERERFERALTAKVQRPTGARLEADDAQVLGAGRLTPPRLEGLGALTELQGSWPTYNPLEAKIPKALAAAKPTVIDQPEPPPDPDHPTVVEIPEQ